MGAPASESSLLLCPSPYSGGSRRLHAHLRPPPPFLERHDGPARTRQPRRGCRTRSHGHQATGGLQARVEARCRSRTRCSHLLSETRAGRTAAPWLAAQLQRFGTEVLAAAACKPIKPYCRNADDATGLCLPGAALLLRAADGLAAATHPSSHKFAVSVSHNPVNASTACEIPPEDRMQHDASSLSSKQHKP